MSLSPSGVHTCGVPGAKFRRDFVHTYEIAGYPVWEINFCGEGILRQNSPYETTSDRAHHSPGERSETCSARRRMPVFGLSGGGLSQMNTYC